MFVFFCVFLCFFFFFGGGGGSSKMNIFYFFFYFFFWGGGDIGDYFDATIFNEVFYSNCISELLQLLSMMVTSRKFFHIST